MRKPLSTFLILMLLLASFAPGAAAAPLISATQLLRVNVIDTDGTPVPGAVVQLLTPGTVGHASARTNQRGEAQLDVSGGFSFWLRIWAEDYAVAEQAYVPASDGQAVTVRITPYYATAVGLVTDDLGAPVTGAKVSAWLDGRGLQGWTTTDEQGAYLLERLPAGGAYSLQVEAKTYRPSVTADLVLEAGQQTQIDVELTPATGSVRGEVFNSITGKPAAKVQVDLVLNGWGVVGRTSTDEFGSFWFDAPAAGGAYQLRFGAKGYETVSTANFTVEPGSWTDFSGANRLTVNPLFAELSGSVLGDSGSPMELTVVELQRSGLGTVETAKTDAKGFFRFAEIPAGTYRVRALPNGNMHGATDWVVLNGGDKATADVVANSADTNSFGTSAIVGVVKDNAGEPLKDALVVAFKGPFKYEATTDSEGRYRLQVPANVEEDPDPDDPQESDGYHVTVSLTGYLPSDQHAVNGDGALPPALVDVQAKRTSRADFTLQLAEGGIAGQAVDERGRPLADATVVLVKEGVGEIARTKTNRAGRYTFANLQVAKQTRFLPVILTTAYYESSIAPDGALTAPFAVEAGTVLTRTLTARRRNGTIQGMVSIGGDRPATGAKVTVTRPADGQEWTSTVSSKGTYSVTVPVGPADEYLVKVGNGSETLSGAAGSVSHGGNRSVTVNMSAQERGSITGIAYDEMGTPQANLTVKLWVEAATEALSATTDSNGQYRFDGLEPGRRYTVAAWDGLFTYSVMAPGEPIVTPLLTLNPGETLWADVLAPAR